MSIGTPYAYICIWICTYISKHTWICSFISMNICMYMQDVYGCQRRNCIHLYLYVHKNVCLYVYESYVCLYMCEKTNCICIYMSMSISLSLHYICMYRTCTGIARKTHTYTGTWEGKQKKNIIHMLTLLDRRYRRMVGPIVKMERNRRKREKFPKEIFNLHGRFQYFWWAKGAMDPYLCD